MQLETVGEIVRILRARRQLEQVELARSCGWRDASAVSRIETDRIRPTRRTLIKLADALAGDATGGPEEIRAWLFRAAGIPPTAEEVRSVEHALPDIESWGQPAMIIDFTWTIWRANHLVAKMMQLPPNYAGRNYLELIFEPDGMMREKLGEKWERVARLTVLDFRADTRRQSDRRWHKKLLARLNDLPDFTRVWNETRDVPRDEVYQRRRTPLSGGTVAMVRLTIAADPRLLLTHVIPEDAAMTRLLVERGVMLA